MPVQIIKGNIFTTKHRYIVNTINCVGVMGAGIALECRLRYPEMFKAYVDLCAKGQIDIGLLWIFKAQDRNILNFPTKKHWKNPSKIDYLHAGLEKFLLTYQSKNIESIAFPLLGADKGGIPQEASLEIMLSYLNQADINIEIYQYDPVAKDDLYDKTKEWLLSQKVESIASSAKLKPIYVSRLIEAMQSPKITQLNQLARIRGIGIKTMEKIFAIARQPNSCLDEQLPLFPSDQP